MKTIRKKISHLFYWVAGIEAVCGVVAIFFLQRLGIAQIGSIILHAIAVDKWEIISEERAVWMMTVITRAMFHGTISLVVSIVFFPLMAALAILIGIAIDPNHFLRKKNRKVRHRRRVCTA